MSLLQINGNPLDKVKSLNEAIDMVRNSADKVTLLIQKKGIKPPSTPKTPKRTPKPEKPPAPSTTVETEVVEVRTQAVEQSARKFEFSGVI